MVYSQHRLKKSPVIDPTPISGPEQIVTPVSPASELHLGCYSHYCQTQALCCLQDLEAQVVQVALEDPSEKKREAKIWLGIY